MVKFKRMNEITEKILNLIYPQVCSICGKVGTKPLCNRCKVKLNKEFCFMMDDYKDDNSKNFVEHYYFFKYENIIRSQLLSLKFKEKPYTYKTISYFLENKAKNFEKIKKYDIIIIVPISKKRLKERGYNQSELIAKEISKITSIKIEKNILQKIKNNPPQSTLNKEERQNNAKGVYQIKNIDKLQNKKILIIDDIYTTGNTLNECARMLVENNIDRKNIGVLTIAKD